MAPEPPTGFLTLRLGKFQRTTRATAAGGRRVVNISDCTVTRWSVFGENEDNDRVGRHRFSTGNEIQISVVEAKPGEPRWEGNPEKIGAIGLEHTHANVYLSSDAFSSFWAAADATDGADRSVELELKSDGSNTLWVTNVGFFEDMPAPEFTKPNKEGLSFPKARVDPVVVGIGTVQEQLKDLSKSLMVAFYVLLAILFVVTFLHRG